MEPAIPANVSDISSAIPVAPAQFVYPGGRAEITTQIILVHGGWQGPEVFSRVVPGLERAGYAVSAVALPSAGLPVDADEDAKVIRSAIIGAIELGKDVILVMHSYGAIPGCEALKGLKGKELEARARGWGKVLKLVFISALVLPVGSCIYPDERGNANKAGFEYEDGLITITDAATRFFNDLCSSEASYWIKKMRAHSRSALASKLTYPAYKYYPSSYLFCTLDNAIPLWVQQKMAAAAGITETSQIETGHFPQLSQPRAVRNFIRKSAGESLASL